MIRIQYGREFLHSAKQLPKQIQSKLDRLLSVLAHNPYDSQLHTKKLHGELVGYLSFRITRDWRVMFQFLEPDSILLLRVKHRKDIYR
ncbi:type II toxin-antitoxin system mRNA interferase toxin, RelE/StbE family [Candidatus Uhrbacteria bacterium]|nr:type II toxin-antitoxin system mRNA interferase toxin, RelE/StbE family [Candidatus Uhrbacteria bacterium]